MSIFKSIMVREINNGCQKIWNSRFSEDYAAFPPKKDWICCNSLFLLFKFLFVSYNAKNTTNVHSNVPVNTWKHMCGKKLEKFRNIFKRENKKYFVAYVLLKANNRINYLLNEEYI